MIVAGDLVDGHVYCITTLYNPSNVVNLAALPLANVRR